MILNHKGGWWIKERPNVEEAEEGDLYTKKRHRPRRMERRAMGRDDGRWQKKQDGGRGRKAVETSQGKSLERQRLALELNRCQDKGRCNSLCTDKTPEDHDQRFHWPRSQKDIVHEEILKPPAQADQQVSRWWIDLEDLFPRCQEKSYSIGNVCTTQKMDCSTHNDSGEEGCVHPSYQHQRCIRAPLHTSGQRPEEVQPGDRLFRGGALASGA